MFRSIPARIVFWQVLIGIAGAVVFGIWLGPRDAVAALAGGGIGAVLSLYFAARVFSRRGAEPRVMLWTIYRAEALKMIMAAGLFTVAAIYFAEHWLPLLMTFMATQSVYGFALLWKTGDGY